MRKLDVDMNGVLDAMTTHMAEIQWFLDLQSGRVEMLSRLDDIEAFESRLEALPGRYALIPAREAREDYALMRQFAEEIDEPDVRELLDMALAGRGAFARFRGVLSRFPDLQARWNALLEKELRDQALQWLSDLGIEPLHVPPEAAREPAAPAVPAAQLAWPHSAVPDTPWPTLYELLVLGGKVELLGGVVWRRWVAPDGARARDAFVRLARELYERAGIAWRRRFVQDTDEVEVEGLLLRVDRGEAVVALGVPSRVDRWELFRS